ATPVHIYRWAKASAKRMLAMPLVCPAEPAEQIQRQPHHAERLAIIRFGATRPSSVSSPNPRNCAGCAAEADKKRSEEHTSELQSRENLVCRLLLEKKNKKYSMRRIHS